MSIQRRVVFYDAMPNGIRFHDWAETTTSLGKMYEPFDMSMRQLGTGIADYDSSDLMAKIDDMQPKSIDFANKYGDDANVIGGWLYARDPGFFNRT